MQADAPLLQSAAHRTQGDFHQLGDFSVGQAAQVVHHQGRAVVFGELIDGLLQIQPLHLVRVFYHRGILQSRPR